MAHSSKDSGVPAGGAPGRAALAAVRCWPLWQLPRWLICYLIAATTAYLAAIAAATTHAGLSGRQLILLGGLAASVVVTVELTRRAGENAGHTVSVYGIWQLPVAVLLPPMYALLMPALRIALTGWRGRRIALHKRVFSAAVIGLATGAASVLFHQLPRSGPLSLAGHPSIWLAAVTAAWVARWLINVGLLMPAIKGADPTASIRGMLLARETVHNDLSELSAATLITCAIATTPLGIAVAIPVVTALQRAMRHDQLLSASRMDSKTGLLNAGTWEREAATEIARAARTRTPLAVVIIDLDHFKEVNDTHGHLAGDYVLRAIASLLRQYDLVGRFGGEEFALLLPGASLDSARTITERIRNAIAALPLHLNPAHISDPVHITASIGVAIASGTSPGSQLTDLMAAADMALYRAKNAGRNQTVLISDDTIISTHPQAEHTTYPAGTEPST